MIIIGLDNGFNIKAKSDYGEQFLEEFGKYHSGFVKLYPEGKVYMLAYWRKCHNIRRKMFDSFPQLKESEFGGNIKISELPKLKGILIYFLKKKNWTKDGSSFWTWEQQLPCIANQIFLITELMEEIEDEGITDKDIEIYFYDSY